MGRFRILGTEACLCMLAGLVMIGQVRAQSIDTPSQTFVTRYFVQLGSFTTRAEADKLVSTLTADGMKSVSVATRGEREVVLLGSFEYLSESETWKDELRRTKKVPEAFVVVDSSPLRNGVEANRELPSVFDTGARTANSNSLASMKGVTGYDELAVLDKKGNEEVYRTALEASLASHAEASDPMRGYIMANLGILDLKKGKANYPSALAKLMPVARGDVAASASVRTMAMSRCAWLLHYTGDRERSLCAYRELQNFTTSDAVRANARVEEVGILLELAESGKGNHAEMRHAAELAYAATPEDMVKPRAVLELMYAESFDRQHARRDSALAARLCEQLVAKYTPLNKNGLLDREIGSAKVEAGMFHEYAGNIEKAASWYERTLLEVPKEVDAFAGCHPHAEALGGLARIAKKSGDFATKEELVREILADYPDSEMARRIRLVRTDLAKEFPYKREGDK